MKASIKDYLRCGGCRETLMYGNINSDGKVTTVKCATPDCKYFGIDYKLPVIELVKASVVAIDEGFMPEELVDGEEMNIISNYMNTVGNKAYEARRKRFKI